MSQKGQGRSPSPGQDLLWNQSVLAEVEEPGKPLCCMNGGVRPRARAWGLHQTHSIVPGVARVRE